MQAPALHEKVTLTFSLNFINLGSMPMLKKLLTAAALLTLLISAFLLPACTQAGSALNGSGKIIDRNIDITDFDGVQAQGDFNVEITDADSYQVTVSTDENLISRVLFSKEDKTLVIKIEAPATFFPTILKITIAMPQLNSLNLMDKAKATVNIYKSIPRFDLVMDGESYINGDLNADLTNFYLSGHSQMSLIGESQKLQLKVAGGSKLDLSKFLLSGADVELREGSSAILNVDGDLNVVLKDASKIYYLGNPLIKNTSITGDSSMIHQ